MLVRLLPRLVGKELLGLHYARRQRVVYPQALPYHAQRRPTQGLPTAAYLPWNCFSTHVANDVR